MGGYGRPRGEWVNFCEILISFIIETVKGLNPGVISKVG